MRCGASGTRRSALPSRTDPSALPAGIFVSGVGWPGWGCLGGSRPGLRARGGEWALAAAGPAYSRSFLHSGGANGPFTRSLAELLFAHHPAAQSKLRRLRAGLVPNPCAGRWCPGLSRMNARPAATSPVSSRRSIIPKVTRVQTARHEGFAASASRRLFSEPGCARLGEMQCRSGVVASGDVGQVASRLINIRTKFARTFGHPAGECGWSGEPPTF
jgi:hypothetical protein